MFAPMAESADALDSKSSLERGASSMLAWGTRLFTNGREVIEALDVVPVKQRSYTQVLESGDRRR